MKTDISHNNPFPGLRPFAPEEARLFFGRESQVDAMVDKLSATRFLSVIGSSGSGKSSLVNCGLIPALQGGMMSGAGTAWHIAHFRPGSDPIGEMAKALGKKGILFQASMIGDIPVEDFIEPTLRISKLGLIDIVEKARLEPNVNVLIVVDQFEELFRYGKEKTSHLDADHASVEEATAFTKLLLEANKQKQQNIYIALTMRSDFLSDCTRYQGLAEIINAGQYLVPRMTRTERKQAILGPIAVEGAQITPLLINRVINDCGDNPDQLSIMQHALNRTWAYWEKEGQGISKGPIDLTHYESKEVGGMSRALDNHAEKAFKELNSPRLKQICEKVFEALVDKVTDPRGVRRPTAFGTLCEIAEASDDEVSQVLSVFRKPSRSFLMPPEGQQLDDETIIDISHESLMRVWKRLKTWSEEEVASVKIFQRLRESAELHKDKDAELYEGADLEVALKWQNETRPNEAWANNYGGGIKEAQAFLEESMDADLKLRNDTEFDRRWHKFLLKVGAIVFILYAGAGLNETLFLTFQPNSELEQGARNFIERLDRFAPGLTQNSEEDPRPWTTVFEDRFDNVLRAVLHLTLFFGITSKSLYKKIAYRRISESVRKQRRKYNIVVTRRPASAWRRLSAQLIDLIIVLLASSLLVAVSIVLIELNPDSTAWTTTTVIIPLLPFIYVLLMVGLRKRATYGRSWLGLSVIGKDDQPIRIRRALVRTLLKYIFYFFLIITALIFLVETGLLAFLILIFLTGAFWMALLTKNKQTLYDKITGTRVQFTSKKVVYDELPSDLSH